MSFRLNEKLKIKQCSVSIANAGDQLPCLSPGGALLPQLRNLVELTWLLKLGLKMIQELQFLFNWMFRYRHIVLKIL